MSGLTVTKQPGLTRKQGNFGPSYYLNGEHLTGVTTILGLMDKPALKQWAADMAVESLAGVLQPGQGYTETQLKSFLESARGAFRVSGQKAKDRGTVVHDWAESHIYGKDLPIPEDKLVKDSISSLLELEMMHSIEYLEVEYAAADPVEKVVVRADALARVDGELSIIDFKTAKPARNGPCVPVYIENHYQTEVGRHIMQPLVSETITRCYILLCPKDGSKPELVPSNVDPKAAWIGFLGLKRFRDSLLANGWKPSW